MLLLRFKGLIPSKVKSRPQCCDDDAMIICGCMARLKKNDSDLHDLLVDYYVGGMTFMALARRTWHSMIAGLGVYCKRLKV